MQVGTGRRWIAALAAAGMAAAFAGTVLAGEARADSPIAIGPYLAQPTPTGMTVCWVSDADTTGATITVASAGAAAGRVDRTVIEHSPATRYHRVALTGLRPYTRYTYRVSTAGTTSGPVTFITAARPGQEKFRFVAYGDNRSQPVPHAQVTARVRAFHPDFVLQSGDMVADGSREDLWAIFWQIAQPLYAEAPVFPALGNHENHGAPYFRYFGVPAEYSFDYGDAHFVALDSNRPEEEWTAQQNWLRADLLAHQRATWRIVFFHHTPYTCVAMEDRREAAEILRARLEPIFEQGHVQLVVNGHDHTYQRHVAPDGITYVVSGGGGAPLYAVRLDTPYVKAAESTYNDCEITVNGRTMSVRAVRPDGSVIDAFTIHASGH